MTPSENSDAVAALTKLPVWVTWFHFDGKKVTALVRAETEAEAIQRMVNWNPDIKLVSGGDGKHYGAILWDTGVHYENDEASPPTKTLKQVAAEVEALLQEAEGRRVQSDSQYTEALGSSLAYRKVLAILTTSTDETDGKGGTGHLDKT